MLRRWLHRWWWPTLDPDAFDGSSIVVAQEWFTPRGGSEQVAAAIVRAVDADALVCLSAGERDAAGLRAAELVPGVAVHECRIGRWMGRRRRWQLVLPLMPLIWASLDLGRTGTVITSSHALVNSIRRFGRRICFCHTPVRYGWEWRMERHRLPPALRPLMRPAAWVLRRWDRHVSARVDVYVANSRFVADRIRRAYGRSATVVHPPIDTDRFVVSDDAPHDRDEYLLAGRLVAYKRPDVAVSAASRAGVRLVVAGAGPERDRLAALAGSSVRFVDDPDDAELLHLLQGSRALVHPGVEDFGMLVVEAQACGTPVIARSAGGALESMCVGVSGLLVDSDDVDDWAHALVSFSDPGSPWARREWAQGFSSEVFARRIRSVVESATAARSTEAPGG